MWFSSMTIFYEEVVAVDASIADDGVEVVSRTDADVGGTVAEVDPDGFKASSISWANLTTSCWSAFIIVEEEFDE